jgi:pyruvate dehydrogenase E2 component (dihydrolipoamide acetyltransferase)
LELESYQNGTLLHVGTGKGGKLQVNDLLAIIGKEGEDISALISGKTEAPKAVEQAPPKAEPIVESAPIVAATASSIDYSTMEEVVLMPRLSDTMTEGVVAGWQKKVGDTVKKGDVLADIETDKATMELESYKDGILLYQGAKAGEKIQVNDLLCIIGKDGLNIDEIVAGLKKGGSQSTAATIQEPAKTSVAKAVETPVAVATQHAVVNEGRIFASPLAKKLASEKGVDLKYVKGTGDNGRIVKADVDNFNPSTTANSEQSITSSSSLSIQPINQSTNQQSYNDVPVSQMRKVIAKRLSESLFTAPHFYLTMSIDMDAAVAARTKLNADGKTKISFNDMVLKATAMALKQHPKVNSSWMGDFIRYNNHINIGVAVAVEDGLLVPVVRNADSLTFSQIGVLVKDYAQKAKDKKLQPSDWEGNTFTISNLGMYGIDEFTAIINPPDSCILAVGGISQVPVVKNGAIVPGNIMKVTLSCDHRVVDGATGSAFLQTLKSLLEEPLRMLA